MKITTSAGTIVVSQSTNNTIWYFRTYPFKVVWYLEWSKGKQESKRFALVGELTQFLLSKWGPEAVSVFVATPLLSSDS